MATFASVIVASGCAGPQTHVEMVWSAPRADAVPLHHVVTVFLSHDGALRRSAEDRMAYELARRGIAATPSYRVLPNATMQNLDQMKAQLRQLGYDGIVTMRFVGREQSLQLVPPDLGAYWDWAYPYFWPGTWAPGYAYTETVVRMETNAYSLATDRLVWSALSKTLDPRSARGLIDDVSRTVANRLVRQGLAG